jgi:hypothetical protein
MLTYYKGRTLTNKKRPTLNKLEEYDSVIIENEISNHEE